MDPTSRSVPADRLARIEAILERAGTLSGTELPALVFAFRIEGHAGEQDRLGSEYRRRRFRAISIAIARSGLARQAGQLQGAAASAVLSAAARQWKTDRLGPLGLLFDAQLAAADAVLAVLLEDHLSKEVAELLSQPFESATTSGGTARRKRAGS
jgi:hypothetical protein